ncbi:MAG: DUF5687 family protein [Prevotellaceae bacterium]|jgi:hypothetical protein|nr:DUF5687 family protein [Prevotellaceae bacterium]
MNLILFEWKLMTRNKRLKQQFVILVFFPLVVYMYFFNQKIIENAFYKDFLLIAMFLPSGACFAPFSIGMNSAFIEKQITIPIALFKILQAKYRLYCIIALFLFIILLPSVFLGVKIPELVATFFFSVGFLFFVYFLTVLLSYKAFDIKGSSFINYQGADFGNWFLPAILLAVIYSVMSTLYIFFSSKIIITSMAVTGLICIATSNLWLNFIAKKIVKKRYYRLERFREK